MGPSPVPAAMLDTPFGFQENADDITAKAVAYFRESVQREMGVASYRSADVAAADPVGYEQMLARLREAAYVFAGPGSPSYALEQWAGSQVPLVLAEKLRTGGAITFASAAACTLGTYALPVYEVYKVGRRPHWLDGLDLVAEVGLRAVIVPHFNNAEGGNHDTRFCYMGERRLSALEDRAARRRLHPGGRRAHRLHPRPGRGHGHRRRDRGGHRSAVRGDVDAGGRGHGADRRDRLVASQGAGAGGGGCYESRSSS